MEANDLELPPHIIAIAALANTFCQGGKHGALGGEIVDAVLMAGGQMGTTFMSPSENDPFFCAIGGSTGISRTSLSMQRNQELAQIDEQGYIEVEDEELPNILKTYEKNAHILQDQLDLTSNVAFFPTDLFDESGYEYLGSEAVGALSDSGFSGVVSIYNTPVGMMSILEEDLSSSGSITVVHEEYLNTTIATYPASLVVMKSKKENRFVTEIFWSDPLSNREYTVNVESNLNDQSVQSYRLNLINTLSNHFSHAGTR